MSGQETLDVKAVDEVKMKEVFGKLDKQMKGIGGTLHVTSKDNIEHVSKLAWQLSEQTQLPVIVVVRAQPKQ
jgi:hypothetical protein